MNYAVQFVMDHLLWFVSVPTLAIFIALMVFVPGAWMAVFAFLRTTFGKVVCILGIGCLVSGFFGWELRAYVDSNALERARQASVEAASQALLDQAIASSEVEQDAAKRTEEADRLNRTLQGKIDDYVKYLATQKGDRCNLTLRDVRSLRGIAGSRSRSPKSSR